MNNNTALSVFTFQDIPVRTFTINNEIYFVVADACKVLDIVNVSQAIDRLDQDGVCQTEVIDSLGRKQNTTIANEPNLYQLIFRSDKPNAKTFQNWVYKEVLPSIRKTGSYALQPTQSKELKQLWKEVHDIKRVMAAPTSQRLSREELKEHILEAIQEMQEDYPEGVTINDINLYDPWFSLRNYPNCQIAGIANKLAEQGLLQAEQIKKEVSLHYHTIKWYYSLPKK